MHGKDYPSPPSRFLHEMQLSAGRFISAAAGAEFDEESSADTHSESIAADAPASSGETFRIDDGSRAAGEQTELGDASPPRSGRRRTGMPFLTTGADLLNGTAKPVEFPLTFTVGMAVRHPQLGLGQVTEAQGSGKWRTVTVAFQSGESVSFVVHKCPLQPVGAG